MKRLYKSRKDKMIAGVCGGIGEYFDIDPVVVRILFVVFTFIGGFAIIAYIVGLIVMPQAPLELAPPGSSDAKAENPQPPPTVATNPNSPGEKPAEKSTSTNTISLIFGVALVILGAYFLMRNIPFFNHYYWWLKHKIGEFIVPGIFILGGVALLVTGTRKDRESER